MGASQSIPSTSEITDAPHGFPKHEEHSASTKNGPKTKPTETNLISVTTESAAVVQDLKETNNDNASVVSSDSDYYSSDDDEDFDFDSNEEKEADEFIAERRLILQETRKLREIAGYYYHPEEPVAMDPTSSSRCFFSRYSAETAASGSGEEAERELVMADATSLKKLAVDYLHPEKPVASTDATAFGRSYFGRASAPDSTEEEEEEGRECIMEDMKQLKVAAEWYLQPEKPVTVDPTAFGRNVFSRPSAQEEEDETEERALVIEEATELKKMADWCMHPEKHIFSDTNVCGRNYYTRVSAPDYDDEDIEEERERIMEDMKQLKTTAEWYLNRDMPVAVDSTACGRSYFSRPSAIHDSGDCLSWQVPSSGWQLSFDFQSDYANEMEEERIKVLAEAAELKKVADWYMHPEKPVATDGFAAARNYFNRHSAVEEEDYDSDLEERNRVFEEAAELKKVADWYMHPEKPVVSDACATGRNFFARPSAPDFETEDDMSDRENTFAEMNELKTVAGWYLHPEKPVEVSSTSYGRNYFDRPSATNYEDDAEEQERDLVLKEAAELKMVSEWYMHPEKPLAVHPTAYGRNYFNRPSAPEDTEVEERDLVLQEAAELKKVAEWYMHPEKPVTVYSTACGRNYFNRPSAPEDTEVEERDLVLQEAAELKKVAEWYMHPEEPVTVYSTACGRNYFTRPSAPEYDEEERDAALADALELKMVAEWYMQPEKPVTFYATACGRNYFTRPSALIQEENEEELKQVLSDANELKMVAEWYMHPEEPVTVYATACGRNFFSRPAAFDDEMEEERNRILAEANELKKVAGWYLNPEKPVEESSTSKGRNYFTRPSAPEYEDDDFEDERDQVLAEAKELKEVAGWYQHPEESVTSNIGVSRNYFTRPSAPEYEDDAEIERNLVLSEAKELKRLAVDYLHPEIPVTSSIGVTRNYFTRPSVTIEDTEEESTRILADALELKKLAVDYLHPEKPVATSSINCARNYFDRPSAPGHEDYIHSKGHANEYHDHMEHDYVVDHDDYQHYDYDHDVSVSHNSFHSQSDHFEMDEDVFHGFRDSINAFRDSVCGIHEQPIPVTKDEQGDGKEGNLSRSPSSIMLFEEAAV